MYRLAEAPESAPTQPNSWTTNDGRSICQLETVMFAVSVWLANPTDLPAASAAQWTISLLFQKSAVPCCRPETRLRRIRTAPWPRLKAGADSSLSEKHLYVPFHDCGSPGRPSGHGKQTDVEIQWERCATSRPRIPMTFKKSTVTPSCELYRAATRTSSSRSCFRDFFDEGNISVVWNRKVCVVLGRS